MPFVKLDCGILKSTIWSDSDGRIVFLTALLMATPREYEEPVPQINVRDNSASGWCAPAGWYGFVAAASTGIAKDACLPIDTVRDALERLGAPDHESRSPEYDGRRLIRVNGGYLVLNFQKYRDFDYGGADRQKRYRERQKRQQNSNSVTRDVTAKTRDVTQAEAEAEAEATTGSNLSSPKKEDHGSKTFSARSSARGKKSGNGHGRNGNGEITEAQFAAIASTKVQPWTQQWREMNPGGSAGYEDAFNRQNFGFTFKRYEELRQKYADSS